MHQNFPINLNIPITFHYLLTNLHYNYSNMMNNQIRHEWSNRTDNRQPLGEKKNGDD